MLHPVSQNIAIWLLAVTPFVLGGLSTGQEFGKVMGTLFHEVLPTCLYFAFPIYIHGFFIIRFLYRGQYLTYLGLFIANVVFWSLIGFFLGIVFTNIRGVNLIIQVLMVGSVTFLGALIRIARDAVMRYHEQRQAELQLLREQLNPHFLFNTLNNLYGLAVQKSDRLPPLMLKLSDLLRFSLYETREEMVTLDQEIGYLRNYISLESLRLAERADIDLKVGNIDGKLRIAPLLLIVFIENCFKHLGSRPTEKGFVAISLKTEGNTLVFQARNSKLDTVDTPSNAGGIGLNNARKRLQLLYPGRHSLLIDDQKDTFEVNLKVKLS